MLLLWSAQRTGRLADLSFREARITIGYRTRVRFRRRKQIAGDDPSRDITSGPGKASEELRRPSGPSERGPTCAGGNRTRRLSLLGLHQSVQHG